MPTADPRVDAYIAKAPAFAQPILGYLRALIHATCPDAIETIKWGMPCFLFQDRILCGIAAFKQHCSLWFWKARGAVPKATTDSDGMGQFGRITAVTDLPSQKVIAVYLRAAIKRGLDAVANPIREKPATTRPSLEVPGDLLAALNRHQTAHRTFDSFSPSCKREYIDWICEAKRIATRERRIAQAIEWMAEGKRRNWQYQKT